MRVPITPRSVPKVFDKLHDRAADRAFQCAGAVLLRVTVALQCSVATWPTSLSQPD
jgi:hypothetical protein